MLFLLLICTSPTSPLSLKTSSSSSSAMKRLCVSVWVSRVSDYINNFRHARAFLIPPVSLALPCMCIHIPDCFHVSIFFLHLSSHSRHFHIFPECFTTIYFIYTGRHWYCPRATVSKSWISRPIINENLSVSQHPTDENRSGPIGIVVVVVVVVASHTIPSSSKKSLSGVEHADFLHEWVNDGR
jgi:hypothetical protein